MSHIDLFTCLGVEWAAASRKQSASLGWAACGSPGSVVMVMYLRDSDNTVTMGINDDCLLMWERREVQADSETTK